MFGSKSSRVCIFKYKNEGIICNEQVYDCEWNDKEKMILN